LLPQISRAGEWFLHSGIQESNGGVARYYRVDLGRNQAISTEITGYAIGAFVYLHTLTHDDRYIGRATDAAGFLTHRAWDRSLAAMPFEIDPPAFTYFFDCGIVVRGLLAVWRASGDDEFRDAAVQLGRRMAADFVSEQGDFHPILTLPGRQPIERDATRWSRSSGCYQLKSAMAWWDLFEATGDQGWRVPYERTLDFALRQSAGFLPGHSDTMKVMDRLHAFLYFLEGLLPRASEARCAMAMAEGIRRVEGLLREIGSRFVRSDVYAQLLRMRLFADWNGAAPLDREAAREEAEALAGFQAASEDPRIDGGFYFGRKGAEWMPFINPVSTVFAMQALTLWECHTHGAQPLRHLLI